MPILFKWKFDYVAFSIGAASILFILVSLFLPIGFDMFMLWQQLWIVMIYYFATRGRAETNFKSVGIEPIIFLSIFSSLVVFFL